MAFGAHLSHVGHEIQERGPGGLIGAVVGVVIVVASYHPDPSSGPPCAAVRVTLVGPLEWLYTCADGRLITVSGESVAGPYLVAALVGAIIGGIVWGLIFNRPAD